MKRFLIIAVTGLVIFAFCLVLISNLGAQMVKAMPNTAPLVVPFVWLISVLLTAGALKELFGRRRR